MALAGFPQFPAFGGDPAEFGACQALFARRDGLPQLFGDEEESVFRVSEGADFRHASAQLECHGAQHAPRVAEVERGLFPDVVVLACEPQPVAELPIGQPFQDLRDFAVLLLANRGGTAFLVLRVVVRVLHHGLERGEQCRGILLLGRLDEVEAVALVPVLFEVRIDGFQHRRALGMLAQRLHEELRRRHDNEIGEFRAGADDLRDLEQVRVRLHGLRFEAGEELAADEMPIGYVLAQEALQVIVRRLGNAERVARVAGPVEPFLDGHLPYAGQEFLVVGGRDIHLAPLFGGVDQPRQGLLLPGFPAPVVVLRLVVGDVGRIVALRHGEVVRKVVALVGLSNLLKRGPVLLGQLRKEESHVVRFLLCHGALPAAYVVEHPLCHGLHLFRRHVWIIRRPLVVSPAIGVAIARDEVGAAAVHHALLAPARKLQALGQVQFLEQVTDGIGHVLDDLSAVEDPRGRGRLPYDLDWLDRQVGDRP